jgi:hypothetical protein
MPAKTPHLILPNHTKINKWHRQNELIDKKNLLKVKK